MHLTLPSLGLDTDAIITKRRFDPARMVATLTLIGETSAKHAYALGLTGTPPPTPAVGMTGQQRDQTTGGSVLPPSGYIETLIVNSYTNAGSGIATAHDAGSYVEISIANHSRVYADETVAIASVPLIGSLAYSTTYYLYYDDVGRQGGAVTVGATTTAAIAANSTGNPWRHPLGIITTPAATHADTTGGGVYNSAGVIAGVDWASLGYF